MNAATTSHFPEDLLESYSMGKLSDQESAPFEEHLLACPACQEQLAEMDEFLGAARTAMAILAPSAPPQQLCRTRDSSKPWKTPHLTWAVGCAASLLILMAPLYRVREAEVVLTAARGSASIPQVPAGRPVLLRIDVTQIPQPDGYQLEVVDRGGQPIWHAAIEARSDKIATSVPKRLARGRYWIRLYDTGRPWTLLREYGLDVE